MTLRDLLGKNLKFLRKITFLSQDELAKKADVSSGVIKHIEVGRSWPEADNLEAIARALNVKPWELLTDLEVRSEEDDGENATASAEHDAALSLILKKISAIESKLPSQVSESAKAAAPVTHPDHQRLRQALHLLADNLDYGTLKTLVEAVPAPLRTRYKIG